MRRLKIIKKIRIHHEGTSILTIGAVMLLTLILATYYYLGLGVAFYSIALFFSILYGYVINFFRCPIRLYEGDTHNQVIAPADGKIVVIEEVEEHECLQGRKCKMVSIFMSPSNVHANWFPVEGTVKVVKHHNGKFYKAWLPKASTDNERSTILLETTTGHSVLVRQIAGALARRIVTYAQEGDACFIDEHLGFIKFGSRVDLYLPLDSKIHVQLGQKTTGNQTHIATLP